MIDNRELDDPPTSGEAENYIRDLMALWGLYNSLSGYPLHREYRENGQKYFRENTGNLVCSSDLPRRLVLIS